MLEIDFKFETAGDASDDPFLDPYEVQLMFGQTQRSMEDGIRRKLDGVVCGEHGKAPRITITATYDNETEEMDLNYHIDTCCQMFLVRVVKTLNNTN